MTYDKLTIEEFGRHLLSSLDLDPIYVALVRMELTPEELGRWLLRGEATSLRAITSMRFQ